MAEPIRASTSFMKPAPWEAFQYRSPVASGGKARLVKPELGEL